MKNILATGLYVRALLVFFVFIVSCAGGSPGGTAPASTPQCTLVTPLPPNPIPAGFDWTSLATNYCAQLATCGRKPANCVSQYLDVVNTPVGAFPISGSSIVEDSMTHVLVCEDSVEYEIDPSVCIGFKEEAKEPPPSAQ